MFSRTKLFVFLLAFLSVVTLKVSVCGAERNSIELISNGDSLALSKKDAQRLLRRLLDDPLELLCELKKYEQELKSVIDCSDENSCNLEVIQNKLKTNRKLSPIFLIGECISSMCGLARSQNSTRSFYEKTVASYLKKYKNQQRINFVAFASGGLLQELIILAHAIDKHNAHDINIHLVDPSYGCLIKALSNIDNQSGAINIAQYNECDFHDYSLAKEVVLYNQLACPKYLIINQEMFRQFVSIVKQLSSDRVRVFVHSSAEAYNEFCAQHPEMKADVVSMMDLEPGFGYEKAVQDYYRLIYHGLKKGGVAIWGDNCLCSEKLNMIDYIAHKAPNLAFMIVWSFRETMWKHVVHLTRNEIDSSLRYLNRYNTTFVGVHSKQAECSDECLKSLERTFADCSDNSSALHAALKKFDNNEFISFKNEFKNISATKKTFGAALLLAGGIYAIKGFRG